MTEPDRFYPASETCPNPAMVLMSTPARSRWVAVVWRLDTCGATGACKSMGRPQKPGADAIGTLDRLILSRLSRGPMHGFGIADYLHGVSDAFRVEEGSLYPALHRIESRGLIESQWGVSENNRRARLYSLTPRGRRQITIGVSNWRRVVQAVNRVIDPLAP